jgi:DNA-binding winged helix-turn-helix (wHTH) protein
MPRRGISPGKELKNEPGYGIKEEAGATMLELPQNEELPSRSGELPSRNGFHVIRFGEFEADFQAGEIRKLGHRIKLQEQPFKVLQILLENPGGVVTREELQSRIWPDVSYGDFDHAVNVAVGKLRTALGDSAESSSFIETVPRRGYRFIAPVENPPAPKTAGRSSPGAVAEGGDGTRRGVRGKRLVAGSLAAIGCGALLLGGMWIGRRSVRSQPTDIQRLTMMHGTVYSARFTPDGRSVLYSASWERAAAEVYSIDLRFAGSRSLGLSDTGLLAISSSGEMAVLQPAEPIFMIGMKGTLSVAPLTGGSPRQVAENVEWADWSPDGKSLAVVRDVAGKQRLEFPLGQVLYETAGWISHPRVSPDGRAGVVSERQGGVVFRHARRFAAPDLRRRHVRPFAHGLPLRGRGDD